jgi:hypothetical protein
MDDCMPEFPSESTDAHAEFDVARIFRDKKGVLESLQRLRNLAELQLGNLDVVQADPQSDDGFAPLENIVLRYAIPESRKEAFIKRVLRWRQERDNKRDGSGWMASPAGREYLIKPSAISEIISEYTTKGE